MSGRELVIPADRLPPGFADTVDAPGEVAPARPAATVALLRDGAEGAEALLLRRNRVTGFVPGAYVFPGGRVDAADADPVLVGLAVGLPGAARSNVEPATAGDADPPPPASGAEPDVAYWTAAAREVFEETGVLLARDAHGEHARDSAHDAAVAHWREELMQDRARLRDVLQALRVRLDLRDVVYCAHWITPLAEPRRYDTRFFLAALPASRVVRPDPRDMTDAVWLTPTAALARFEQGTLPMVFPTVKTLRTLARYATVTGALEGFRARTIRPVMPRLVRTPEGVGLVIDENDPELEGS